VSFMLDFVGCIVFVGWSCVVDLLGIVGDLCWGIRDECDMNLAFGLVQKTFN